MWVRLKREWRGYWKGSVLNLPDDEALPLLSTNKAIRAKSTDYMKDLSSPPHDKMMRGSPREKDRK